MKITFLGVGNAFTTNKYWQSNMLIDVDGARMLFDCGGDCRHSLTESFPDITSKNLHTKIHAYYVSHIHNDHIGGFEWVGFSSYFNPDAKRPILIMSETLKEDFWSKSLAGGMEQITGEGPMHDDDFFDIRHIKPGVESFAFQSIRFSLVECVHVASKPPKLSYGLFFNTKKQNVWITSDCIHDSSRKEYESADIIFHDCETSPFKTGVHPHYDELKTLPDNIRKKMLLYHYSPGAETTFDPQKDGFIGFVRKGQTFDV